MILTRIGVMQQSVSSGTPPPPIDGALLLSTLDELDPESFLLLSGDQQTGSDVLLISEAE